MFELRIEAPGKNALSTEVFTALEAGIEAAGDAPILLTGAGDAFCAGLNLEEVAACNAAALDTFLERFDRLCARLFDHPAPTVAYLNGHAIAGGAVLALCCDYRVATPAPRTKIGLNETALGVTFPPLTYRIVRHRLGPRHAPEVLLGAGLHDPQRALALGLVDALGAMEDARAELERRAAHPRAAYTATKAALQAGVTALSEADAARARAEAMTLWTGEAFRARLEAALGRRP